MEKNVFQSVATSPWRVLIDSDIMTKERKYILIGGCLLLLFGLICRFYPFGFEFLNGNAGIALKQKRILKYNVAVQQKPNIEKHLMKLNKITADSVNVFLKGTTPALAAVDIQNTLNRIAEKVGISISRIDIQKEKKLEEDEIISIPVRFRITSTTRQLRDMIFYIESSEKLIRIIDIQSNARKKKFPEHINSSITIEGFIRE